jgi:hypothetical protein
MDSDWDKAIVVDARELQRLTGETRGCGGERCC